MIKEITWCFEVIDIKETLFVYCCTREIECKVAQDDGMNLLLRALYTTLSDSLPQLLTLIEQLVSFVYFFYFDKIVLID